MTNQITFNTVRASLDFMSQEEVKSNAVKIAVQAIETQMNRHYRLGDAKRFAESGEFAKALRAIRGYYGASWELDVLYAVVAYAAISYQDLDKDNLAKAMVRSASI